MSRLSELLRQARKADPQLGEDLEAEIASLRKRRTFGLVFEPHQPEAVELPGRPVRRGDKVRILRPRGETGRVDQRLWRVMLIERTESGRLAHLSELGSEEPEAQVLVTDDLVVVAEFRDRIYPGLLEMSRHRHGNNEPFHSVINSENHHALEMLSYTHREAVDLIYIDPPYNTGGKFAWLYNDDYVDRDDDYKHSKWLAFMERRLQLSRELLKSDGAIMVSIGDEEQHRLRMLLDQIFGVSNYVSQLAVEMSTTSGPKTTNAQQGTMVKNVEYVLIYRKSADFDTKIRHTPLYDSVKGWDTDYALWLNADGTITSFYDELVKDIDVWADIVASDLLNKSGDFIGARGMDKLLAFSNAANAFVEENLDRIARRDNPPVAVKNVDAPVRGWVEVKADHRTYLVTRLRSGTINQVYSLRRNYRLADESNARLGRTVIRGDLWKGFHQDMGTVSREGGVAFANGKKPLRLIRQLIRWANNSSDAVILDFFGGSGTTAHAVAQMNEADGGRRQAILVTNNELSKADSRALEVAGKRAGDAEWENLGVFISKTKPRLENAFRETSANAAFFSLTYETPLSVQHHRAFRRIAPMLWLRAGSRGRLIDGLGERGWDVAEAYGVLRDLDQTDHFVSAVERAKEVSVAFVVTDDDGSFQMVCRELPSNVTPIRLYESYLQNFEINTGRS